jgi:hypothetical protein
MHSTNAYQRQVSDRYLYQPLDFKKHQIRLLKLRAGAEYAFDYQLTIFDFESAPSYVALSYTWGPGDPTAFVTIDGKSHEIRPNLFNFLKTYQEDVYLWIDQICIDQSNHKERAHQVGLMSMIYAQCAHVLVWLRDESTHVPSTYQAALDLNKGVELYPKHDTSRRGSDKGKNLISCPILILLHNSYFGRLWIVQEILLNENIRILVEGSVWVTWDLLRTKYQMLSEKSRKLIPNASWMMEAHPTRFIFGGYSSKSLSSSITLTAGKYFEQKCDDPRDKVYGFMGLVAPASTITVDYTKSVQAVYLEAFRVILKEYWDMIHDIPENGFEIIRIPWKLEESRSATWNLAKAMGLTNLELCGLKSFNDDVWEKIRQYEVKVKLEGKLLDSKTHCISSIGCEPEKNGSINRSGSRGKPTTAVSGRWWYKSNGKKYYHDCR